MNANITRRLVSVALSLVCVLAVSTGMAQAETISVGFSNTITTSDAIGIGGTPAVANWNLPAGVNGATLGMYNDSNVLTGVTLDYSGEAAYFTSNIPTGGTAAEQALMSNGLRSGTGTTYNQGVGIAQFRFSNLNSFASTYDVYIAYTDVGYDWMRTTAELSWGDDGAGYDAITSLPGTAAGLLRDGFVTVSPIDGSPNGAYPTPDGGGFSGWVDGASDSSLGNYIKITGLTGDTLVITPWIINGQGQWPYGPNINGIQIVNTAPVPEPSTFVLAGLGLVGLAGFGLRRRVKK